MQAWRVHGVGEPEDVFVLDDVDEPTADDVAGMGMGLAGWEPLGPGHEPFTDWVLLRMRFAALALPDVTMARGDYPVPVARPYTSGQEGVGDVIATGPGREDLLGKRVAAVCIQPWGSLAPVAVGVSMVAEVPEALTDEQAAGFLIPAHTAYHAAIRRGGVTSGETVVVLGAAGGLGSAVVQLCLAQGARLIAVVGGPKKVAFCQGLGAEAVDHLAGDVVEAVRALVDSGADVLIDPVQGDQGAAVRAVLAPNGRHVLCGHAGGLIAHDPNFYLFNHTLVGVTLGGYPPEEMQRMNAETHEALARLLAAGTYRPTVERVIDFTEVPAALVDLKHRRTTGRVVVTIPEA
jgi:NADPH2:quinone reductase